MIREDTHAMEAGHDGLNHMEVWLAENAVHPA